MPPEIVYDSNYFLNLYNENTDAAVADKKEEEEEEEEEEKLDSSYFLNQYNTEVTSAQEERETISQEEELRAAERIELEEQILEEDVDLKKYVGEKELVRDAEPTIYNANYFLNQYNTKASKDLPSTEPTTAQKIQLGGKLERHTLGNLFRTAKAGFATLANNNTFQENIKAIEGERRDKIFTSMQKKYGVDFRKNENDAAVIAGRVGAAFGDIVTFFIPWAKIAKLGKLGATAVGAGVGATDMALYEYAAYGEVNPNNVLFGAAVGGGSSLLGSVVANRFQSVEGDTINLGKIDSPDVDTVVKSSVKNEKIATLNSTEIDELDKAVTKLLKTEEPLLKSMEASPLLNTMYRKAQTDIRNYQKAKDIDSTFNPTTGQLDFPDIAKLDIKNKTRLSPTKLKNLKKKAEEAEVFMSDGYLTMAKNISRGNADIVDKQLRILNNDYKITDSLLTTVLNETFRPLFGGGVGFAAGTFIGDEDDTINYTLMGAGMTFGFVYNRIKNADYLLKGQKEKAFGIINNESMRMLHNFLKIKGSGTTVNRAINHGEELEIVGRNLFNAQDGKYRSIIGAESATELMSGRYATYLTGIVEGSTEAQRVAAGKLATKTATRAEIKNLGFSTSEMSRIDALTKHSRLLVGNILSYTQDAGVTVKKIENYDLPQMFNKDAIMGDMKETKNIIQAALKAQFPAWDKKAVKVLSEFYPEILINSKTGKKLNPTLQDATKVIVANISGNGSSPLFVGGNIKISELGRFTGIPQLKNFQKERVFESLEARKILEPILVKDVNVILGEFIQNTTKGVEFARKMGQDGELINSLYRSLKKKWENGLLTDKEYRTKIKTFSQTIEAYFGLVHKNADDVFQGNHSKDAFAILTFLSNTTMLTRSTIVQLGDFLQPFQNSNISSAIRGFAKATKKDSLAAKYRIGGKGTFGLEADDITSTIHKDLEAMLSSGGHPSTPLQQTLANWTKTFFKFNGMAPATNYAAKGSFDTGADELYRMGKKLGDSDTISRAMRNRLNYYGASRSDIQKLSKFNTFEEAVHSPIGEQMLVKAGNQAFNRDVGLPRVGNRLFFAMSNNPAIKSMGLFLSWAQYKTAQMNMLISRVEDGDVKLAIKMLGTITIFGGLREMQIEASPAREYYEENEPRNFSPKWWGEAFGLSGGTDWRVEKFSRVLGSWAGSGHGTATTAISPLFGLLDKWYNNIGKVVRNTAYGDYEGAAVAGVKTLPGGSEFVDYANRLNEKLTEETLWEDKANIKTSSGTRSLVSRKDFTLGGKVGEEVIQGPEVPFTQDNAADRINPITGLPYNQPAITYK